MKVTITAATYEEARAAAREKLRVKPWISTILHSKTAGMRDWVFSTSISGY